MRLRRILLFVVAFVLFTSVFDGARVAASASCYDQYWHQVGQNVASYDECVASRSQHSWWQSLLSGANLTGVRLCEVKFYSDQAQAQMEYLSCMSFDQLMK